MAVKKIIKPTIKPTPKLATESTFWDKIKKFQIIISLIIVLGGFLVGYVTLLNDVKELKKEVAENTTQLKKMNDILSDQQLLNGKIIQYMQMK